MHRSPLSVLVIVAAVAACSTHDDSNGTELLSQDRTLAARVEIDREARQVPLPSACGTITLAAQPAAADQTQAKELTSQAQDAEIQGNMTEARTLLRRALQLDATNKSAAYRLGRMSEALGDRAEAKSAFCRYLALVPTTAESAEARQRVHELSQSETRVLGGSVSESAPKVRRASIASAATRRRVTHGSPTSEPRVVAKTTVEQSAVSTAQEVESASGGNSAGSGVVATQRPQPDVDQTSSASSTVRRGPTRAQSAIVGAATGAILGAVTGHSVKGTVIGAAAGGIFGTVVGGGSRPRVGRGIRS
ncbi:MAG: YMGG-like glycine zipper-containing protein [Gemmatimonadaceae bacterium]